MIKTPLSTMIGGAFWTPSATILGGTSKTFDQIIKTLFANNEQGFAYDPNDLSTMFRDAAGTVPVTGVDQPVGLILDKSKGLVLGSELVVNGSFDTDTAWVKNTGVTISGGIVNINTTATTHAIAQSPSMPAKKHYKVTYTVTSYSSGGIRCIVGGGVGVVRNAVGTYTEYVISAGSSTIQLASSGGFVGSVDNFTIKEIIGNHAYQTTSSSRPILRQNATTGAYYLEFDGSDDFLVTNSVDFTVTDKVSLFAGVRKLSDAATGVVVELSIAAGASINKGSFVLFAPSAGVAYHYNFRSFGTSGAEVGTAASQNFPAPHSAVLRATGVISTSTCELLVNGGSKLSTPTSQGVGNYGNYPLYIGRRGGTTFPFNGHIYSLIGVGRLTTDDEITAIEKELAKRTGVTLS